MKVLSSKNLYNGPVSHANQVVIECNAQEAEKLRDALALINRYKLEAYRTVKHKEKNSDWTMVGYGVKNDKVIVKVESGSCG